ncbi:MAG TPA: ABC transporter ATP-binding protein [Aeromicrobium sp.]|jgi:lipopolysaccharide transport system ATP-binding protein|nr:ABC transporter ATP-binding protein [Aeromicrobium sp.]HKY56797.1 ABC transporter ATP-binding protein [Aeromicrobium sp.]
MSPAIEVRHLSKRYRLYAERRDSLRERFVRRGGSQYEDFWALRGIDFTVEPGQTVGIIGHNGSGKSTLLRLMAGIHRPTEGSVVTRGRLGSLLELGAGFHPSLTGRENVRLNAAILGISRKYIDARMNDIAEFAGVERFFDAPLRVYSSGMAVRLGFATAVHIDPEVLLVDEAIAVGDEEFQRKCMEHLHWLRRHGTTIVLVSHSLALIAELCDSAVWLDQGKQQAIGPAEAVIDHYLEEVNRRDADTSTPIPTDDTQPTLPDRVHIGTGEIRIHAVTYADANGDQVDTLLAAEPASFRIHYDASRAMSDLTFGLGFATATGTRVAGPNSGYGPQTVDVAAGPGVVEFHVDQLLLQPAHYLVSAAVVSRQHVIDHIEGGFDLAVHSAHAITEPGVTLMPGRWVF